MKDEWENLRSFLTEHLHGNVAGKSFGLRKVAHCSILWATPFESKRNWMGRGCKQSVDLVQDFGWQRDDVAPQRVALADRYGGMGIGPNGGSGRAGYLAGVHIKGIGPTDLIGSGNDGFHATGSMYLQE